MGYYRLRIADGILDPLDLISVAFNDGNNIAGVISADFIGFHEVELTKLRNRISKEVGIPAENVFLSSLALQKNFKVLL